MAEDARFDYDLADESDTAALARRIASVVAAGDLVTLSGDLGAGKTTLARALIRELMEDPDQEVPSPTFTLMQVYEAKRFPIVHADLYRIKSPDELVELGWEEASEGALLLVEWADRAGPLPETRLDVQLRLDASQGDTQRKATLVASGYFAERLRRALSISELLNASGWGEAKRTFMMGDASTRAYERLEKPDGARAILMISPRRPDGPPVRMGKPYSAIARLAEDVTPFLALSRGLRTEHFSAPEIYAAAPEQGLAILEDLGALGVVDADGPMPERYGAAVSVLAALHARDLPATVEGYTIPPYDIEALSIEVELLIDWYAPHIARAHLSSGARATFVNVWREALEEIVTGPRTWTLRDYHSPNLMWLPERDWLRKVGILDFQDCVMGHPAYDVASLLQDARVTVSDTLEMKLLGQYLRQRREADPAFAIETFARAYAIMGAQRATKVLGIFARLDKRDGKPGYLAHIPRVKHYLLKDLSHPALVGVKVWFETHMPSLYAKDGA
ncbi:MAG: tRNA ((37)-N6)-threonylcarbamoyltransferase complex ATPase subunit type 1 TsaE [Hyphomicrobiales bacterium]|nr:tRNA ((37)-N6)-threonylcarbamoyltransferase complex ATPase subunit type 1 TsaE [Hyphomicrobiales bacterium]